MPILLRQEPKDAKAKTLPEATHKACEQHGEAIKSRAGALALKPLAWLRTCTYRSWRRSRPQRRAGLLIAAGWLPGEEGEKARNVHIWSCAKMDVETARQKGTGDQVVIRSYQKI